MSRRFRFYNLETKTARSKLPISGKPYLGPLLAPGVRLAFRHGKRTDSWSTYTLLGTGTDHYRLAKFAKAENLNLDANGTDVLTFQQAVNYGKKLVGAGDESKDAPITVDGALATFETDLRARGARTTNATYPRRHLSSSLLARPVMLLTAKELRQWRDSLLEKGLAPSSITRLGKGCLRPALELAAQHDQRIRNREAWATGLEALPNSQTARDAILAESRVHAFYKSAYTLEFGLGVLIHALAVTGARPSQVVRALVADFIDHLTGPKITLPRSAKGGGRNRVANVA